jgi:DNA-3-methyladenine glycosylase II
MKSPEENALPEILNQENYKQAIDELCIRDYDFKKIIEKIGPPPIWSREPGFSTLVRIILEQQVSLRSAKAAFDKLVSKISPLSPENFLSLSDEELKEIGFSRQKSRYCRLLATEIVTGYLNLDNLALLKDNEAKSALMQLKGIGHWTGDIYLLMALNRADVWPAQDLALAIAVQKLKNFDTRPSFEEIERIAESWRPWRAVAARILWHFYLSEGFKNTKNWI